MITACENVCRDFHWLGSFSDWGPTLLASATALIIAFKAYPWQKGEDRKLQIGLEQRKAYEGLVKQFTEVKQALVDIKFQDITIANDQLSKAVKVRRELLVQINAATILMHAEIVPFVFECYQSTSKVLIEISEELNSILEEADVGGIIDKRDLSDRCKVIIRRAVVKIDEALEKLVNEIRVRAYSLDVLKVERNT